MHIFDILTILCIGLMVGNELTVSLFINPSVQQLEERTQAQILSLFARLLGKAMPIWYALSLALILAEAWFYRRQPAVHFIYAAAVIWVAVIVYTIATLVPINNRIAALMSSALPTDWRKEHKKWDTLHRWRIAFLLVSITCLLYGILGSVC